MIVEDVTPLGINNIDGSKMCRVTFRCDMDAARAKEAKLAANAGNAVRLQFSIKPNGEGGTIITPYGSN
jgi:hypothetical protein